MAEMHPVTFVLVASLVADASVGQVTETNQFTSLREETSTLTPTLDVIEILRGSNSSILTSMISKGVFVQDPEFPSNMPADLKNILRTADSTILLNRTVSASTSSRSDVTSLISEIEYYVNIVTILAACVMVVIYGPIAFTELRKKDGVLSPDRRQRIGMLVRGIRGPSRQPVQQPQPSEVSEIV